MYSLRSECSAALSSSTSRRKPIFLRIKLIFRRKLTSCSYRPGKYSLRSALVFAGLSPRLSSTVLLTKLLQERLRPVERLQAAEGPSACTCRGIINAVLSGLIRDEAGLLLAIKLLHAIS